MACVRLGWRTTRGRRRRTTPGPAPPPTPCHRSPPRAPYHRTPLPTPHPRSRPRCRTPAASTCRHRSHSPGPCGSTISPPLPASVVVPVPTPAHALPFDHTPVQPPPSVWPADPTAATRQHAQPRPGPPAKVAVPVLLLALACFGGLLGADPDLSSGAVSPVPLDGPTSRAASPAVVRPPSTPRAPAPGRSRCRYRPRRPASWRCRRRSRRLRASRPHPWPARSHRSRSRTRPGTARPAYAGPVCAAPSTRTRRVSPNGPSPKLSATCAARCTTR